MRKAGDSPDRFIPMIMVTGHSERARITEDCDAGINKILVKPISATHPYLRIKSVIDRPENLSNQGITSDPTRTAGATPIT